MNKKSTKNPGLSLKSLLKSMPDLYLILNAKLEIVEVSEAYAKATHIKRDEVLGRTIFDVFPDNPENLAATGVDNLSYSLDRVLKEKAPNAMAVQKYDITSPEDPTVYEEHFWSPVNSPIFDEKGDVAYIIHRVQDVTDFVKYKQKEVSNKTDVEKMEIEIFHRAQDIQKANRKLYESEERMQIFMNSCKDYALFMLDLDGYIISWNAGAERIKGYRLNEVIGKHFSIFYPPQEIRDHLPEKELETAKNYGRSEDEGWRIRKDGSRFWGNSIITPLYDLKGQLIGYGKVTRDLTERKKSEEEIVFLSNHDPLTNLHNRAAFIDSLKKEIAASSKNNTSVAVLIIDLDNFKTINDTFGHHVGDQLLVNIAKQLQDSVRKGDFVGRIGGDEFVIIFPDITNESNVKKLAEKLLLRFNKPFMLDDHYFQATISIGIAVSPAGGIDENALLKNADIALYTVKELGRNNYQIFSAEIKSIFNKRAQLESLLPQATLQNQFFLVFQPQFRLPDKQVIGMEALLRWQHPELGLIMPNDFIPVAERNGFIVKIGEWVLRNACEQYIVWQRNGLVNNDLKLAVNMSPIQLLKEGFIDSLNTILQETQMSAKNLVFELPELEVIKSPSSIDVILEQLQSMGITISIDDFGSGYASFTRLKNLPISSLKIDKEFISTLDKDPDEAMIVKSIISLGTSLGLDIISEGVETEKQLELLQQYQCQMVQGFYFGKKPLKGNEMTDLLEQKTKALPPRA